MDKLFIDWWLLARSATILAFGYDFARASPPAVSQQGIGSPPTALLARSSSFWSSFVKTAIFFRDASSKLGHTLYVPASANLSEPSARAKLCNGCSRAGGRRACAAEAISPSASTIGKGGGTESRPVGISASVPLPRGLSSRGSSLGLSPHGLSVAMEALDRPPSEAHPHSVASAWASGSAEHKKTTNTRRLMPHNSREAVVAERTVERPRPLALVVGGSRGIGLAVARSLAANGSWDVHATTRSTSSSHGNRFAGSARDVGIGGAGEGLSHGELVHAITWHQLEVRNDSQQHALARSLRASQARLELCILSAGVNNGTLEEQLEVNAHAPFRVVEALMAPLRRGGARLCILTSDLGTKKGVRSFARRCARTPNESMCAYSQSKLEANKQFRLLEPTWRHAGVVAAAMQPGFVATDMNHGQGRISAEESARGVVQVCSHLHKEDSGRFLDWRGNTVPW